VDFKKQLFWIVLGVVLIGGVGAYFGMSATAEGKSTDELEREYEGKKAAIAKLADKLDGIKNAEHVKLAKKYKADMEAQAKALEEEWHKASLKAFDPEPPKEGLRFDNWLGDLRKKLVDKATQAQLQLPTEKAAIEKLLLVEPTSDESTDVTRHRSYRIRHMAVFEEVINILSKKYGKQPVTKQDGEHIGQPEMQDVGPTVLERFTILPPKLGGDDRQKAILESALARAGKTSSMGKPPPDLPYMMTCVDVVFVAPANNVAPVAQALEASDRYRAVVTRMDFQRVSAPFPLATDARVATAGAVPMLNTFYQEAPVRALVSFDIYEFDPAAAKAETAAPPKVKGK